MEMMEKSAISNMAIEKTDPCWFCKKKEADDQLKNDEDEDPESPEDNNEDNVAENYETNDASKLGQKLGNRPTWKMLHKLHDATGKDKDPIEQGTETDIVPAAHHLIPGNASLKKAPSIHPFMLWQKKNPKNFSGPIGYNINSAPNGIWLPGNYAVRAKTDFGKNWSGFGDKFKNKYAEVAMENAQNRQLHDAHTDYNNNVRDTLIQIGDKLEQKWEDRDKCPVCGKPLEDKKQPPYGLVGRLNLVSAEHKKPLQFPKSNKKAIQSGYYTSSRVINVYG